jgi:hypothetical protein
MKILHIFVLVLTVVSVSVFTAEPVLAIGSLVMFNICILLCMSLAFG